MSTSGSTGQIRELRTEVMQTNAEIRMMTRLAREGKVALRDLLVLVRAFTGGDPRFSTYIANAQMSIAVTQTAKTVMTGFLGLAGPPGWLMLAMGIGTFTVFSMASEMDMRSPEY